MRNTLLSSGASNSLSSAERGRGSGRRRGRGRKERGCTREKAERNVLDNKLPQDVGHDMIRGTAAIERKFICEALSCDPGDMNRELMTKYMKLVADRLLSRGTLQIVWLRKPFLLDGIDLATRENKLL